MGGWWPGGLVNLMKENSFLSLLMKEMFFSLCVFFSIGVVLFSSERVVLEGHSGRNLFYMWKIGANALPAQSLWCGSCWTFLDTAGPLPLVGWIPLGPFGSD